MFTNNEHMCAGCSKGLPACTCNRGAGFNQGTGFVGTGLQSTGLQTTGLQSTGFQSTGLQSTGLASNLVGHTHTHSHNQGLLNTGSTQIKNMTQTLTGSGFGSSNSHRFMHQEHIGRGQNRLETCNICLGTEFLDTSAPIIERIDEKPVVITHHEGQVVQTHGGQTIVQTHQEAAQIRQHIEKPIVKEVHQQVIHEHHKDILHEHRQNIVHEHHQPIIHEVHQPIIHEKHIHEVHQPIIHEKHQTLVNEQHKNIIHEKKEYLVEEQQRQAVIHEKTAQPIVHCNKEAAPIVQNLGTSTSRDVVMEGQFREGGHLHTHNQQLGGNKVTQIKETIIEKNVGTTGLNTGLTSGMTGLTSGMTGATTGFNTSTHTHSHGGQHLDQNLATGELHAHGGEGDLHKKSFGQKIKEVFTGRTNEPTYPQGTLNKQF